ncbi:GPW/gp25 family protein [Oceanobacter mangrovi]|uniref:GPW/gp25 family protein n=1 Tax=Oceanobacter mangrovi TaxID=2862510 RepID=UPI001C8E25E6|nr:GPW/gp25 family protein [Oceanobacter mangrovi]
MGLTLLEKLDSSCSDISLQDSIQKQVQRIIATRMYIKEASNSDNHISGFGIPEFSRYYADNPSAITEYLAIIRSRILALEPRLDDIQVLSIQTEQSKAGCQLAMKIGDTTISEYFYF